jgi:hypothetical protein
MFELEDKEDSMIDELGNTIGHLCQTLTWDSYYKFILKTLKELKRKSEIESKVKIVRFER